MDNDLQQILSFSFPRRWNQANIIGTLINWDNTLEEGWSKYFISKQVVILAFLLILQKINLIIEIFSSLNISYLNIKLYVKLNKHLLLLKTQKYKLKNKTKIY